MNCYVTTQKQGKEIYGAKDAATPTLTLSGLLLQKLIRPLNEEFEDPAGVPAFLQMRTSH
jgi:hypothetical protein